MELDNNNNKQTYIQLLIETLRGKHSVLMALSDITSHQAALMAEEVFDEELFDHTITDKEALLHNLAELDRGFDQLYDSIKADLSDHKYKYMQEIMTLQELITAITDLSVKLQAMELNNKTKLESLLSQKRRDIHQSKKNGQSVAKYYQSMARKPQQQSYFYDKMN